MKEFHYMFVGVAVFGIAYGMYVKVEPARFAPVAIIALLAIATRPHP